MGRLEGQGGGSRQIACHLPRPDTRSPGEPDTGGKRRAGVIPNPPAGFCGGRAAVKVLQHTDAASYPLMYRADLGLRHSWNRRKV
jgi:hypothetical protein